MINFEFNCVRGYDINEVWRDAMWLCIKNGYDFVVEKGSYEGQIRKQLDSVFITITNPETRPLAPILPAGIPAPTDDDKIATYFVNQLMGSEKAENEEYTYGEFITKQIDRIIDLLIEPGGNTNQATICIGNSDTTFLPDPPCLRSISFKVVNGKLNMTLYFRSWDLYAGLPENLGGLQLLKEFVFDSIYGYFPVEDGSTFAYSDGLHIYEQYFDLVNQLNVDKININKMVTMDKIRYLSQHGK